MWIMKRGNSFSLRKRVPARYKRIKPRGAVWISASIVGRTTPKGGGCPGAGARADGLLLDEPVSALDVSVQAEVLNLLAELREQRQLTFLVVAHDPAVVAHMCEQIAVM